MNQNNNRDLLNNSSLKKSYLEEKLQLTEHKIESSEQLHLFDAESQLLLPIGDNSEVEELEVEYLSKNPASFIQKIFTPLGISALLIFILTNTLLVMFWRDRSQEVKNIVSNPIKEISSSPKSVKLDLNNLSTLTIPKSSTMAANNPVINSSTAKDNCAIACAAPKQIAPKIASFATLALPPTSATIYPPPTNSDYYYIISPYTGEAAWQQAQQETQNAALINMPQTTFIYMGGFEKIENAHQFMQNLHNRGMNSYIYHPQK
jgi:hypothetical protein